MEATNHMSETPLRHAVLGNHVAVLDIFHHRGAAFVFQDRIGSTALHDAILLNSSDCLRFLLGLHMRVDLVYLSVGQTALHLLAENANISTMKAFNEGPHIGLDRLDIAARDGKGLTALDYLDLRADEELRALFELLLGLIQASSST